MLAVECGDVLTNLLEILLPEVLNQLFPLLLLFKSVRMQFHQFNPLTIQFKVIKVRRSWRNRKTFLLPNFRKGEKKYQVRFIICNNLLEHSNPEIIIVQLTCYKQHFKDATYASFVNIWL